MRRALTPLDWREIFPPAVSGEYAYISKKRLRDLYIEIYLQGQTDFLNNQIHVEKLDNGEFLYNLHNLEKAYIKGGYYETFYN